MLEICEHESYNYSPRTKFNAKIADVTVAFAFDLTTHGEILTKNSAGSRYIGFKIDNDTDTHEIVRDLYRFMIAKKAKTLNIAGNGIYTIEKFDSNQRTINLFIFTILSGLVNHIKIEKIYTGGQTGVDIGGAIAADLLGIDVLMTLPLGYRQRFENGVDIKQTKGDIESQIEDWGDLLKVDIFRAGFSV